MRNISDTERPRPTRARTVVRTRRAFAFAVVLVLGVASSGWAVASGAPGLGRARPAAGGQSLTVLEPSGSEGSWKTLDPLFATASVSRDLMNAIYGNLFLFAKNGKVVPDLAQGYRFSNDGKSVSILLRKGVTFSDGTPFDASSVAFNFRRDLTPKYACTCLASFPVTSIDTPSPYTVTLNFGTVIAPVIDNFYQTALNYIASPTALRRMGASKFGLSPVAAGPFEVVRDQPGALLSLKRNPHYWQKGHPYLSTLTFKSIGTDESAYEALVAGNAGAYQGVSTYSLLKTAEQKVRVTYLPPNTGAEFVELDTFIRPFDNIKAREAIYYATDPAAINKAIFLGRATVVQSGTSPGPFYQPKVPGYREYDLAKAKALVKQLGGLSVDLGVVEGPSSVNVGEALQSQWKEAGIRTSLKSYSILPLITEFQSGKWGAMVQGTASFSPALRAALPFRWASNGSFTEVHDHHLDSLIDAGSSTLDQKKQAKVYREIWSYINEKAYSPFLFALPAFNFTARDVSGPGLTDGSYIAAVWEDVRVG